jgi:hypothetical protein
MVSVQMASNHSVALLRRETGPFNSFMSILPGCRVPFIRFRQVIDIGGYSVRTEVILSVDHAFTVRDRDYGQDIWMVRSPENLALASDLRSSQSFKSVTVFNGSGDRIENLLSMLPTVFEHHPQTELIIVRGLKEEESGPALRSVSSPWIGEVVEGDVLLRRSDARR